MTIRVGVFGAGGRMGATVCDAVAADPGLELVAAVDPHHEGASIEGLTVAGAADAMVDVGVERRRMANSSRPVVSVATT